MNAQEVAKKLADHGLLELAQEVATRYHVTLDELLGRSRHHPEAIARRELWARAYAILPSLVRLGALFGRDHTSILASIQKYKPRPDTEQRGDGPGSVQP